VVFVPIVVEVTSRQNENPLGAPLIVFYFSSNVVFKKKIKYAPFIFKIGEDFNIDK
jgi:hypothetical protein